jgi:hypothetical protein
MQGAWQAAAHIAHDHGVVGGMHHQHLWQHLHQLGHGACRAAPCLDGKLIVWHPRRDIARLIHARAMGRRM